MMRSYSPFTITTAIVVLLVASGSCASEQGEVGKVEQLKVPKAFNFGEFAKKFSKHYDQVEASNKARLFYARTVQIFKHNVEFISKKIGHYLNQNEYIDMSAEEIRRSLVADSSELVPVKESLAMPQMPADDYYRQSRDGILDGYSQSSGSEPALNSHKASLNFFAEPPSGSQLDPRELLRGLQTNQLLAKRMARVVQWQETSAERGHHLAGIHQKRTSSRVDPQRLNPNFDPSLISSQRGWGRPEGDFSKQYANLLMSEFGDNLEPYPTPQIPKMSAAAAALPSSTGSSSYKLPASIGSFMNLVRDVYGIFSASDAEEEDIVEGAEEEEEEEEEKVPDVAGAGGELLGKQNHSSSDASAIKYDIDWRLTGCVGRVKAQKECNACYVFAALDLMEFFYCRQTKSAIEFSAQYVIDCGFKTQLNGCEGGKLSNVGIFIKKHGIQSSAMYPYAASVQHCPYGPDSDAAHKSYMLKPSITKWKLQPNIEAWYQWLPKTPLIVGINMPADFLAYGGGIHQGQDCVPGMVHAMVLAGSGVQDGKTFWLLKNTFSSTWGEQGYFRLSKRAPLKCFNSAIVANAKF